MRYSVIYKIPVLLALALAACTPGNKADTSVAVTGVSVSPSSAELKVGQTLQLTANVLPDNASNKSVSWASSDAAIASVDQRGKLSALKEGSAVITVTTQDGGKTGTCNVSISKPTREDVVARSKASSGTRRIVLYFFSANRNLFLSTVGMGDFS